MNSPVPLPSPKVKPKITQPNFSIGEDDIFSNAISSSEFIRQIKVIQQSVKKQDIDLRNAAQQYMNTLHCV